MAQWYSIIIGVSLFIGGMLLMNGTFEVSGLTAAWIFLIVGLAGVIAGLAGRRKSA